MEAPPDKLKYAAIAQIVAGLVNIFITGWVMSFVIGTTCTLGGTVVGTIISVVTLGLCPIGLIMPCLGLLGFFALLAVPLGILEVIAGILGLTSPKSAGTMMKIVAVFELLSLLIGALPGVIAGGVVLMFLSDEQVKGYLEAP